MSRKHPQDKHKCARCGIVKLRAEMCQSSSGRVQSVCLACDVPPPGMKWCTAHKCWEPVENFGLNRARRDGMAAVCLEGKGYYDKQRRAESLAARGEMQDDVRVIECGYCYFEVECRGMLRQSFAQVRRGEAPALGDTVELPCIPGSPRYSEYARFVRAKRVVNKTHKKATIEMINYVMTVGD